MSQTLRNRSVIRVSGQTRALAIVIALVLLAGCVSHAPAVTTPVRTSPSETPANSNSSRCLSLAMYWEARGEGHRGMIAVGSVVLNRVQSRDFPNSVCAVVYQGGEAPPCQFSWWCDGKSDRPRNRSQWLAAQAATEALLSNRSNDPTGGALFFHSTSIRSSWHRTRPRTAKIGNHIFYR